MAWVLVSGTFKNGVFWDSFGSLGEEFTAAILSPHFPQDLQSHNSLTHRSLPAVKCTRTILKGNGENLVESFKFLLMGKLLGSNKWGRLWWTGESGSWLESCFLSDRSRISLQAR